MGFDDGDDVGNWSFENTIIFVVGKERKEFFGEREASVALDLIQQVQSGFRELATDSIQNTAAMIAALSLRTDRWGGQSR